MTDNQRMQEAVARREAVARTFDITPNHEAIFKRMVAEAKAQSKADHMFDSLANHGLAEALRCVQRWFAPLTLALNAASSVTEIEELRLLMTGILADVNRTATAWETGEEEEP